MITVKASRYLTHVKRLRDPQPSVDMLMERVAPLREKLGPVLIQLPPDLPVDTEALDATLAAFPMPASGWRWSHGTSRGGPTRYGRCSSATARRCAGRTGKGPITPLWRTADWGYLRFHEGAQEPWPFYTDAELRRLGRTADRGRPRRRRRTVYVYFNNDPGGGGPRRTRSRSPGSYRPGCTVTRVPVARPDLSADPDAGSP